MITQAHSRYIIHGLHDNSWCFQFEEHTCKTCDLQQSELPGSTSSKSKGSKGAKRKWWSQGAAFHPIGSVGWWSNHSRSEHSGRIAGFEMQINVNHWTRMNETNDVNGSSPVRELFVKLPEGGSWSTIDRSWRMNLEAAQAWGWRVAVPIPVHVFLGKADRPLTQMSKKKVHTPPSHELGVGHVFLNCFDPQISTLQPAQVVIPFMRIAIPNHQPKLPVSHSLSFCDPIIWSGSTVPNPIPVSSNIPNLPDSLCIIVIWEHNSQ